MVYIAGIITCSHSSCRMFDIAVTEVTMDFVFSILFVLKSVTVIISAVRHSEAEHSCGPAVNFRKTRGKNRRSTHFKLVFLDVKGLIPRW